MSDREAATCTWKSQGRLQEMKDDSALKTYFCSPWLMTQRIWTSHMSKTSTKSGLEECQPSSCPWPSQVWKKKKRIDAGQRKEARSTKRGLVKITGMTLLNLSPPPSRPSTTAFPYPITWPSLAWPGRRFAPVASPDEDAFLCLTTCSDDRVRYWWRTGYLRKLEYRIHAKPTRHSTCHYTLTFRKCVSFKSRRTSRVLMMITVTRRCQNIWMVIHEWQHFQYRSPNSHTCVTLQSRWVCPQFVISSRWRLVSKSAIVTLRHKVSRNPLTPQKHERNGETESFWFVPHLLISSQNVHYPLFCIVLSSDCVRCTSSLRAKDSICIRLRTSFPDPLSGELLRALSHLQGPVTCDANHHVLIRPRRREILRRWCRSILRFHVGQLRSSPVQQCPISLRLLNPSRQSLGHKQATRVCLKFSVRSLSTSFAWRPKTTQLEGRIRSRKHSDHLIRSEALLTKRMKMQYVRRTSKKNSRRRSISSTWNTE